MPAYLSRLADVLLPELLLELPALAIVGPRATGKTTTARRHVRSVAQLDRPAEAAAFRADPDAALTALEEPALLDEWQAVPEVLGAVKRSIDRSPKPGRYVLTGSVRTDLVAETWPGTGRVVRLSMFPLTVGERSRRAVVPLIERMAHGNPLAPAPDSPDLLGYLDLALASGFPEAAFARSSAARQRWLESYVEQLLTRDAAGLAPGRDPARLRRFFEACALGSAGLATGRTLMEAAGVDRRTAIAYEQLLKNLLVMESLPAWSSNRLKRLTQTPKRYVIDPGLIAGALAIDRGDVLRDGDLLGRVLETFVAAELRAQSTFDRTRPRLYHLRTEQGRHEIDFLAEVGAGSVIAIEVKATSAPDTADARHLTWFRDLLESRFLAGVLLHTGPRTFELSERIVAAPISALWA